MIDDRVRGAGPTASDAEIQAATPRPRGGNQVRVGLFVLAGFISVIAVIFLMTDPATLRGRYMVFTQLPDAGGVRKGDAVQMRGVIIGRVHDFEFINGNQKVSIQLEIENKWHIPTDSHTRLAGQGLVGGRTMEIVPGPATTFFEAWDTIPATTEASGDIMATAGQVADKAGLALDQVNKLLSDPTIADAQSTVAATHALLTDLNTSIAAQHRQLTALEDSLSRSLGGLRTITDSLAKATPGLANSAASATARADSAMVQIRVTLTRLDRVAESVDSILARMDAGQGTLGKLSKDSALYDNLARAADEIALLAKDLRENPKKYLNFRLIGF